MTDTKGTHPWFITFIYRYPQHHFEKHRWTQITNLIQSEKQPWLLTGDLNEIANTHEKRSIHHEESTWITKFNKFIQKKGLID